MTQLDLLAPASRFSDPSSSHSAAAEHDESGRRNEHASAVLSIVHGSPGLTYREISARLRHLEPVEVMRRLNDLAHAGAVQRGAQRKCNASGRLALTWW